MPKIIGLLLSFLAYLLLQSLVFNYFTLGGLATPFVFLAFLLFLPLSISFPVSMLIAFFSGIFIEIFSADYVRGLHAFSCVLMMAVRLSWIELISTRNAYKGSEETFLRVQTLSWYLYYFMVPVFVHHLSFFLLEAFSFSSMWSVLFKTVLSSIYTVGLLIIFSYLFYIKSERR